MILTAAKLKPMLNTVSFVCRSNAFVSCKPLRIKPQDSARLGRHTSAGLSIRSLPRNEGADLFELKHCLRRIHFPALNAAVKGENGAGRGEPDQMGKKPLSIASQRDYESSEEMGRCAAGEIHVIVGPMFAGKTTALLRRIQEEIHMGRRVMLVKSEKDTRYGSNFVVSHDGEKMPCWAVADLASFKAKLGDEAYKQLDVIGIDEAQFFKDLYSFCQHAADDDGKTVIVAGLDGDFLRKSFGSTLELIPLADSVMKLTSRCGFCGKPALFTFRKTRDTETEVIGGADVYMPVCRQHYVNRQIVLEAENTVLEAQQLQCDSHLKATALAG